MVGVEGATELARTSRNEEEEENEGTYCSLATIFIPSSSTPVTLLLRYCRTGAPCAAASAGIAKPVVVVVVAVVVFVAVPAGVTSAGCCEAARDVGCPDVGVGVGMRAVEGVVVGRGEGAVVGVPFGCGGGWAGWRLVLLRYKGGKKEAVGL